VRGNFGGAQRHADFQPTENRFVQILRKAFAEFLKPPYHCAAAQTIQRLVYPSVPALLILSGLPTGLLIAPHSRRQRLLQHSLCEHLSFDPTISFCAYVCFLQRFQEVSLGLTLEATLADPDYPFVLDSQDCMWTDFCYSIPRTNLSHMHETIKLPRGRPSEARGGSKTRGALQAVQRSNSIISAPATVLKRGRGMRWLIKFDVGPVQTRANKCISELMAQLCMCGGPDRAWPDRAWTPTKIGYGESVFLSAKVFIILIDRTDDSDIG
jgi:hypothetical protein